MKHSVHYLASHKYFFINKSQNLSKNTYKHFNKIFTKKSSFLQLQNTNHSKLQSDSEEFAPADVTSHSSLNSSTIRIRFVKRRWRRPEEQAQLQICHVSTWNILAFEIHQQNSWAGLRPTFLSIFECNRRFFHVLRMASAWITCDLFRVFRIVMIMIFDFEYVRIDVLDRRVIDSKEKYICLVDNFLKDILQFSMNHISLYAVYINFHCKTKKITHSTINFC